MNCLEFRRLCAADPNSTRTAFRWHRRHCAACASFAAQQEALDRKLTQALQVPVPEALSAKILLAHNTRRAAGGRRLVAYAASVLMTFAFAAGVVFWEQDASLDQRVMGHIFAEPQHLSTEANISQAHVAAVLARNGVELRGDLGLAVHFAENCPDSPGAHLVLAGSRGPVTVMIMPAERVAARQVIAKGGFSGVIVPAGSGSMAIVGLPGEPVDEYEQRFRAAMGERTRA